MVLLPRTTCVHEHNTLYVCIYSSMSIKKERNRTKNQNQERKKETDSQPQVKIVNKDNELPVSQLSSRSANIIQINDTQTGHKSSP